MTSGDRSVTAADLPHSCPCGERWSGLNTAHCTFGCHATFSGVTSFDKHQKSGKCVDPADVGLELLDRRYPCWGTPKPRKGADGALGGVGGPTGEDEE